MVTRKDCLRHIEMAISLNDQPKLEFLLSSVRDFLKRMESAPSAYKHLQATLEKIEEHQKKNEDEQYCPYCECYPFARLPERLQLCELLLKHRPED